MDDLLEDLDINLDAPAEVEPSSSLLAEYLSMAGANLAAPAVAPETSAPETKRSDPAARYDLDAPEFDAEAYTKKVLREGSLRDLIAQAEEIVSAKLSMDQEMQMLVYDNYNRFISATDMIRKMRQNVESMEAELQSLQRNIEKISVTSTRIEDALAPGRQRVHNLVGVARMLKRLEFLFELPGRLKKSIQLGAYQQAVKYWRVSNRILKQYAHIVSFEKIRQESEGIIEGLKQKLKQVICDPTITAESQLEHTAMLIDLGEPADSLLGDVLATRKRRLLQDLVTAQNYLQRQLEVYRLEQKQRREGERRETHAGEEKEKKADERKDPLPPNLLAALQQHFMEGFVLFAESYLDTFVRPYELSKSKAAKQQHEAVIEKATDALTAFTREVFAEYFSLVRKELLSVGDIANAERSSKAVQHLTQLLRNLHLNMVTPASLVPKARLTDRSAEIIEHSIRNCVDSVFTKAQATCVAILRKAACAHPYVAFQVANAGKGWSREELHRRFQESKYAAAAQQPPALPSPGKVARDLRMAIEKSINLLVPVLSTHEYLPASLDLGFGGLAQGHMQQMLHGISSLLLCDVLRESDGPIFSPPSFSSSPSSSSSSAASPLSFSGSPVSESGAETSGATAAASVPLHELDLSKFSAFYLVLADVCRHMEKTELHAAIRHYRKCFPAASVSRKADVFEHELPALLAKLQENSTLLLRRYVTVSAMPVVERLRRLNHADIPTPTPEGPGDVRPLVAELLKEVEVMSRELATILPETSSEATPGHSRSSSLGGGIAAASRPRYHQASALAAAVAREAKSNASRTGSARRGGRPTNRLNRDIERLFKEKVDVLASISFDRISPVIAFLRVVFKGLCEIIRHQTLTAKQCHQWQLDVYAIRVELPREILEHPEAKSLLFLMDEVASSAFDRCVEATAVPLEEFALERCYKSSPHFQSSAAAASAAEAALSAVDAAMQAMQGQARAQ